MKNTKYKIPDTKYKLTIGWLYPELMSTYGDRGNIIALSKRTEWRGIDVKVERLDLGFNHKQLAKCDLLFMGGAQDRQQTIVSSDLKKKSKELKEMIEDEIPGLYICGAYQFLGKYYREADGTIIDGLDVFDLYTENPGANVERLIGNIVAKADPLICTVSDADTKNYNPISTDYLVGFENHGGRTILGNNVKPLGSVVIGFGNNGKDKTEGMIYKNSIGSYLHGPILPKNPHLADFLIQKALEKKYKREFHLGRLHDSLEWQAHKEMLRKVRVNSA